jgi:hypothetical protein
MKWFTPLTLVVSFSSILYSCNQYRDKEPLPVSMSDSTIQNEIPSIAAENEKDSARKFIRTADLKFKVKDAIKATTEIEGIVNRNGGFVTYTKLARNIDQVSNTAISKDSSIENTYYTLVNNIVLRVPDDKLDTTLKEIAQNSDFLEHRIITADDVSLQILSNRMARQRYTSGGTRLVAAIEKKGNKLNEILPAEESRVAGAEKRDEAILANLDLLDKIHFSTVNLEIYQGQAMKSETRLIEKVPESYEPGLFSKLADSFVVGWKLLENIILLVTRLWSLVLVAVIIFILYKRNRALPRLANKS